MALSLVKNLKNKGLASGFAEAERNLKMFITVKNEYYLKNNEYNCSQEFKKR